MSMLYRPGWGYRKNWRNRLPIPSLKKIIIFIIIIIVIIIIAMIIIAIIIIVIVIIVIYIESMDPWFSEIIPRLELMLLWL